MKEITELDYIDMVSSLALPGDTVLNTLNPKTAHVVHMIMGIATELNEVLVLPFQSGEPNERERVLDELGDLMFYCVGLVFVRGGLRYAYGVKYEKINNFSVAVDVLKRRRENLLDLAKKLLTTRKIDAVNEVVLSIQKEASSFLDTLLDFLDILCISPDSVINHNYNKLVGGQNARYSTGMWTEEESILKRDKEDS